MTPLDSRIDEDFVARLYRGEPFVFEGQLEDVDGAVESLAGRTFWGCVMSADGMPLREVVADLYVDKTGAYYRGVFDGTMTDEQFGKSGLLWSQGERVAGLGRKIHGQGPLIIYPGPGSQAPEGENGIAAIAHRVIRRETPTGRSAVRISQQGARGPAPWEAAGETEEVYNARVAKGAIDLASKDVGDAILGLGQAFTEKAGEIDQAIGSAGAATADAVVQTAAAVDATAKALAARALAGEGAPAANLGVVGNTYTDTLTQFTYGPKTAAGWGAGRSLRGIPGGNVMAVATFAEMATGNVVVPIGTSRVKIADRIGAEYVYDAAVTAAFVTTNPGWSFLTKTEANAVRGFRLDATYLDARMFGYAGTGAVDDAPALNAAAKYLTYSGLSRIHVHGTAGLLSTVFWPVQAVVIGPRVKGLIVRPLNASYVFTAGFMMMWNTSDGVRWTTPYPIAPGGAENLRFSNPFGYANIAGAIFFGGCEFVGCNAYLVAPVFKRGPVPASGSTGEYSDHVKIDRLEVDNPGLAIYAVDIDGPGDALEITRCGFGFGTKGIWLRGGSLKGALAAKIDGIIGGDHLIEGGARSISITSMHNERGKLTISGGSVSVSKSWFAADEQTLAPPIILRTNADKVTDVVLDHVEFFWGFNHFATITYDVAVNADAMLSVRNCGRVASYVASDYPKQGIRLCTDEAGTQGFKPWNDYAHLLSERGEVRSNLVVPLNHPVTVPNSWWGLNGVGGVAPNSAARKWALDTATYYYATQVIFDPVTNLGLNGTGGEKSRLMTKGANEIARLTMVRPVADFPTGSLTKVYRGTATGMYDAYCLLPMQHVPSALFDDGVFLSSLTWVARSAGPMDPVYAPEPGSYAVVESGRLENVREIVKPVEDASITLKIASRQLVLFTKYALTAARSVTLPAPIRDGDRIRIVRTADATGNPVITVRKLDGTPVRTLTAPSTGLDLVAVAGDWIVTSAGAA